MHVKFKINLIMKKLLIFNIILLLAVGYLYYNFFTTKNTSLVEDVNTGEVLTGKIAYINVDSFTAKYELAIELNEILKSKEEDVRTDLNIEAQKLDKMMKSFNRKLNNNGFTSRARAERAQKKIIEKQEELQELKESLTQELFEEQGKMVQRLGDTMSLFLDQYNATRNYDLILRTTKNGNVLHGKKVLDITAEVINMLNERYNVDADND